MIMCLININNNYIPNQPRNLDHRDGFCMTVGGNDFGISMARVIGEPEMVM
jgi:hypothetical protein